MDALDDYLLEYVLFSINDFDAYFSAQTVSTRWYRFLKKHENEKLKQFVVLVRRGFDYSHYLPNGKLHGISVWSYFTPYASVHKVNYTHGLKHGTETIEDFRSGAITRIDWVNGVEHGNKVTSDKNMSPVIKTPYLHGLKHGVEESWYPDGKQLGIVTWNLGRKCGSERIWRCDGSLAVSRIYVSSQLD